MNGEGVRGGNERNPINNRLKSERQVMIWNFVAQRQAQKEIPML